MQLWCLSVLVPCVLVPDILCLYWHHPSSLSAFPLCLPQLGPLHPRHPIEVAAMPEPESLKPAEKTRAKRDRRPLVDTSQGPEPRGAAHKDAHISESKAAPRSARSKSTLPPRAAKESQDEGGPRKTALRPKKKLDNVDQDPRPRATRSTKRGDDNEKASPVPSFRPHCSIPSPGPHCPYPSWVSLSHSRYSVSLVLSPPGPPRW